MLKYPQVSLSNIKAGEGLSSIIRKITTGIIARIITGIIIVIFTGNITGIITAMITWIITFFLSYFDETQLSKLLWNILNLYPQPTKVFSLV